MSFQDIVVIKEAEEEADVETTNSPIHLPPTIAITGLTNTENRPGEEYPSVIDCLISLFFSYVN